jgi:hypothetical protein
VANPKGKAGTHPKTDLKYMMLSQKKAPRKRPSQSEELEENHAHGAL